MFIFVDETLPKSVSLLLLTIYLVGVASFINQFIKKESGSSWKKVGRADKKTQNRPQVRVVSREPSNIGEVLAERRHLRFMI